MEEKRAVGEEKAKEKEEWWEETYADTGCEFSPRCLECPLPACRYDLPPKQAGVYYRALKLLPLLEHGRTRTVDQLATEIGVSRRTVFRLMPYVRELMSARGGGTEAGQKHRSRKEACSWQKQ